MFLQQAIIFIPPGALFVWTSGLGTSEKRVKRKHFQQEARKHQTPATPEQRASFWLQQPPFATKGRVKLSTVGLLDSVFGSSVPQAAPALDLVPAVQYFRTIQGQRRRVLSWIVSKASGGGRCPTRAGPLAVIKDENIRLACLIARLREKKKKGITRQGKMHITPL